MSIQAFATTHKSLAPHTAHISNVVLHHNNLVLQRCTADKECDECRKNRLGLQSFATSYAPVSVPPIVHYVLRSSGQPLETNTRELMGARFGHNFSDVRVHTDTRAAESARAVNALAYTVGRDVVFGANQYSPQTRSGQQLIAHELTHVVQQGGSIYQPGDALQLAPQHDTREQQARGVATNASRGVGQVTALANDWHVANSVQRAAADPVTETKEQQEECAGWFRDYESTSKRAAEHYVRTELVGDRGTVERIECDLFDPDTGAFACTVHFSDGTPIRVIVRKDAIIVGVYPLQSFYPPPDRPLCWYDYKCPGPNRDLVLTKRKCQTSKSGEGASPPKAHGPEP